MKNVQDVIKKAAERYGLNYNEKGIAPTVKNADGTIKVLSPDFINDLFEFNDLNEQLQWTKFDVMINNNWEIDQRNANVNGKSNEFTQFELAAI